MIYFLIFKKIGKSIYILLLFKFFRKIINYSFKYVVTRDNNMGDIFIIKWLPPHASV